MKQMPLLFNELGNAKQMPNETAQEFTIRMMSLREKVLFVSNKGKCGYSTSLIQYMFLHAILVGLRNDNIRYELRPLLKSTTADELEHISRFKNKQTNVHTIEGSEDISKPHRDKNKTKTN